MQSDVTRDIASCVNARLTAVERVALARSRQIDPEVEDRYWKGIYCFNKTTVPDFQRSRDFLERMLQKDPQNARARIGVAMSNLHLGAWGDLSRIPFAKAGALKANMTKRSRFAAPLSKWSLSSNESFPSSREIPMSSSLSAMRSFAALSGFRRRT